MPRKGAILPKPIIGDPNDPDGMVAYLNRYLDWLQINNYSKATIKGRDHYLLRVSTIIDVVVFTISDGKEQLRAEMGLSPWQRSWPHGCAAVV